MITKSEGDIIRYIRVIAMTFIVYCHLLQTYENKWAWFFNIGVQMFLSLSGYLYGKKDILNFAVWFKDKVFKLYIPYIIFVLSIFGVYKIFEIEVFSISHLFIYLFDIQWLLGSLKGIEHLWFMTAIGFCYLSVPFLQYIKQKGMAFVFLLILILFGLLNLFVYHIKLDWFSCVFIYAFSYLFASLNIKKQIFFILGILGLLTYTLYDISWEIICDYTNYINKIFHITLGIALVILPIIISQKYILNIHVPTIIKTLDKYSYYIYMPSYLCIRSIEFSEYYKFSCF